ncbi:oligosaccharide flippase family protein [Neobacillus sp. OS1-2]|uniref:oligosaccharide flippase family protein n=1 Tax=Neobacillus sp. OS1-2 TaxID=3070680 RepID=UPI0027DF24CD|nr:oligosaccharide flippase family protein [Neobacillus sp. OS1-2]WML41536.1 oligosaccharide flippase family protein [Neobacillus sp. OS1-2]
MKLNQVKVGAILSYASILITIFISLLYTPFMLRFLGQSEYGLYSLIGSIVGYLSILDMGLGSAIVRYTARNRALGDKSAESKLNGMFLVLYSLIGLLTVVIGALIYFNLERIFGGSLKQAELHKAKIMMLLLIFNFAISFPLGVFGSIIQAYEKFIFARVITIIRSLINPCIMIPLLFFGYGSVSIVVVNTILNIVCLIINVIYCFKVLNIKVQFEKIDLGLLKEIAGYSFFIFLNVIVDKIYWSSDQFILGVISGTTVVAVYAVAMQFIFMYLNLSTSVSGLLLPRLSMMAASNATMGEFTQMMIRFGRIQYIIMAFIISGFFLFGQAFIKLWAGSEYREAFYIVMVIMVPLTIPLIQTVGLTILQAKNLHGFRSVVYLLIAVLNILISIPLAKIWGGLGSAMATATSLFLGNVIIMNIYYSRKIGLDILLFWKNIIRLSAPVIISLLCGIGINHIIVGNSIFFLGIKIILFSISYILFMSLLGINNYEKNLFYSPVKRIFKGKKVLRKDA